MTWYDAMCYGARWLENPQTEFPPLTTIPYFHPSGEQCNHRSHIIVCNTPYNTQRTYSRHMNNHNKLRTTYHTMIVDRYDPSVQGNILHTRNHSREHPLEKGNESPLGNSSKHPLCKWQSVGTSHWTSIGTCHWTSTMSSEVLISDMRSLAPILLGGPPRPLKQIWYLNYNWYIKCRHLLNTQHCAI